MQAKLKIIEMPKHMVDARYAPGYARAHLSLKLFDLRKNQTFDNRTAN